MTNIDIALFTAALSVFELIRFSLKGKGLYSFFFTKNHDHKTRYLNSNDDEVLQVIDFWFGGNLNENYKTKWFPSGSTELQRLVDEEICTKFSETFHKAISGRLKHWSNQPRSTVALIVVLDQFSRHIYRHLPSDAQERLAADRVALEVAEAFTAELEWDRSLSLPEFVFSLMPFRHAATVERLEKVRALVQLRRRAMIDDEELLRKFERQTARRLQHLQDRAKAEESEEILERRPEVTDESDLSAHPLARAMLAFLARLGVRPGQPLIVSLSGGVDSMVILKLLTSLRLSADLPEQSRILCLHIDYSNRPESLLEAEFLARWVASIDAAASKSLNVSGSGLDLQHMLGPSVTATGTAESCCRLLTRTVTEAKRGVADRDLYERITREIRYGLYRGAVAAVGGSVGVMLGHHQDDLRENVVSNAMRGCSAMELSGMADVGETEGAPVWRPLLSFSKADVFDFAHKYGVPYFKDTTPSWSTRGKLRGQLLPLLQDIYGDVGTNLSQLGRDSDESSALLKRFVFEPFHRSTQRLPCGLLAETEAFTDHPLAFWRVVLRDMMHSQHRGLVREAAVGVFVTRLRQRRDKAVRTAEWTELRKGAAARITSTAQRLMLLERGVLRGPGEEVAWTEDWFSVRIPILTDGQKDISLPGGNWSVSYRVSSEPQPTPGLVSVPGLRDGEELALLSGLLAYSMLLPVHCTALVPLQQQQQQQCVVDGGEEEGQRSRVRGRERVGVEYREGVFARGLNQRLLRGLPLLVGDGARQDIAQDDEGEGVGTGTRLVEVTLRFTPSASPGR